MILFIMGVVIGSIGGMIMMAMFLAGKTRESSFNGHLNMCHPPNTVTTGTEHNSTEKC